MNKDIVYDKDTIKVTFKDENNYIFNPDFINKNKYVII